MDVVTVLCVTCYRLLPFCYHGNKSYPLAGGNPFLLLRLGTGITGITPYGGESFYMLRLSARIMGMNTEVRILMALASEDGYREQAARVARLGMRPLTVPPPVVEVLWRKALRSTL